MTSQSRQGDTQVWRQHQPERLFILGMRGLLNSYEEDHVSAGPEICNFLTSQNDIADTRSVLEAMWLYSSNYGYWALCQTGYHCLNCPCLARDEFLSLSLMSSIQHRDHACIQTCLQAMFPVSGQDIMAQSAFQLATALSMQRLRLHPIFDAQVQNAIRGADNAPERSTSLSH
ncbi:hypothetical protein [Roseibium algae]|uniref:Uncharacterized protein n=1 Tax=Roseibium algae TaxID=3123038 RepID=A0ABU8TH86_9HYPH